MSEKVKKMSVVLRVEREGEKPGGELEGVQSDWWVDSEVGDGRGR